MLAIADQTALYLLKFMDCRELDREIAQLEKTTKLTIESGRTRIIDLIEQELNLYFAGKLQQFETPIKLLGTEFQQLVWQNLPKITYGKTWVYLKLAKAIARPKSYRAVANANGANRLALILPCHRVIAVNHKLGGYNGGLERKIWLLEHERKLAKQVVGKL
jgi:AraC family transcriptional regulator of adaptative response/methylated-DNA-[protein]-cysteine methyltransferase